MRRNVIRNVLFCAIVLVLIGSSLIAARIAAQASSDQLVALSGHAVPLVQQARLVQATDPQQRLHLSIGLQLRNQDDLDSMLSAIYNPQSAHYHQYLSSAEFNQLYAPTSDQVQQVVAFMRAGGLTIDSVASNRLLIDVSGSVAQVERALHVQINDYQVGSHAFYANATSPQVPLSISQLITSIGGLDNSEKYHPLYQQLAVHPAQRSDARHAVAGPVGGYGPPDLSGAYDATPLQSAGIQGDNQTVAIFELDGYQQSDLTQYFQNYGLGSPNVTAVKVDGFNGAAGQGAIEVELDIEVIAAMAPHAKQLIYEGPNTTQGLNDTYNRIVSDDKAQVVSTSWGLCEASTGPAELNTLDGIFKAGAAKGITFYAAAGDSGAFDCSDSNLAVDSPADDPFVTGVGGTNLQLNGSAYGSESVWSNPGDTQRSPKGSGGGGGFSSTFAQPGWQTGPGTGQQNNGKREVPDVSADADPASGYAVFCTVTAAGCPSSGWITVGGTSAAAPLWAGSTALINQYEQSQGQSPVGHITPTLYGLFNSSPAFSPFHDITTGNNLHYAATSGYDMASGIGSPDIFNIARDIAGTTGGSGGGTPTPTPSPPPPTPGPSPTPVPPSAVLQNGGFELGVAPWQESSSGNYQLVDASQPHSGKFSVFLCGYTNCNDRIWQSFTVPADYTRITITYWWYASTNKTAKRCQDTFNSGLQNSAGAAVRVLQQSCNTDATNSWVQRSFDVSGDLVALKGQAVTLSFQGTNAPKQLATSSFFVDDVTVSVQ